MTRALLLLAVGSATALAGGGNVPPELMGKTVADLELSVRSRKALQRLKINTIGELASRTEAVTLATRRGILPV